MPLRLFVLAQPSAGGRRIPAENEHEMSNSIKKQHAAVAIKESLNNLHEVRTLRQIVDVVRYGTDSGDEIAFIQLEVLENVIEEKLHEMFHQIDCADDYFGQKPQKKTKKLAVVKKAA